MKLFIKRPVKNENPNLQFLQYKTKKYDFIDLSTSGNIPKNLINKTYEGYTTVIINDDDKTKELFAIMEYLYENGGVYIQNLKCNPDIFIKNNEMNVYNIHYFSCIKNSLIMKKIIDEIKSRELTMNSIISIFNKYTKNVFRFNKSLTFLF